VNPIRDGSIARTFSLLIAALSASVLGWMLNSPVFDIRNISVHRAESSPPPAVDRAVLANVAQSFIGRNAFRINTARVRDQLRQLPGVADVLIRASLDGRLTITVSYEAPVANWRVGDHSYLVNAEGEVLAKNYLSDLPLTVWDDSHAVRVIADPKEIHEKSNMFKIAEQLADLLNLNVEAVAEKLKNPESRYAEIAREVLDEPASRIRQAITDKDEGKKLLGISLEPDLAPGDLVNVDALFAAHQLKSNLLHLRLEVKRILYHVGGLSIIDHAGRVINFGDTKHLEGKLVALHAVLEQAKQQGERIESVDLRPIDRPTYRTAGSDSTIKSISGSQP
jgi:cell division septal protein FtsQ